jgi:hypothetical protein
MTSRQSRALNALKWLANLGESLEEFAEFREKHPDYLNEPDLSPVSDGEALDSVLFLRNEIRKLWRGGAVANTIARSILLSEKAYYGPDGEEAIVSSPDAVDVDWDNGKLVLKATTLDPLQMSVLELLRISRFAKVCARPGCPAPYFIADKIIQQYCSDECKYEARKAIQNAYWERRGSRVRRERTQRSKATKRR